MKNSIESSEASVPKLGELIAKKTREGFFDFREIMGQNTSEEELDMVIKHIEDLEPDNKFVHELYELLIKWTGYDKDTPERKDLNEKIRSILFNTNFITSK